MATIVETRKLVEELKAVLQANSTIDKVSTGALVALAQETEEVATYISVMNVGLEPSRMSTGTSGYDRHMLINVFCNVNCENDPLKLLDVTDSVEQSVLKDSKLWVSIVDRDLVAINYDDQEHFPKRGATMLFDFSFRIDCD